MKVFGFPRNRPTDADRFVETWKKAWLAGAEARWSNASASNPYAADPSRAAWNAGHLWATDNPDRRREDSMRRAHPLRRSMDTYPRLVRAAEIGAIGIGVVTAARWAWRQLRRRGTQATGSSA